jgi:hypothetical protein
MVGPLLMSGTFRWQLSEVLNEKREAGHAEVDSTDKIELKSPEGWTETTSTVPGDPLCPPPGTKAAFRLCDLCAYRLSRIEGAPRCELYWPEKNRDRAVAACAEFLTRYGPRLRVPNEPFETKNGQKMTLGVSPFFPMAYHLVRLALEVREEGPAGPGDDHNGEAVFCLVPRKLRYPDDAQFLHDNVVACKMAKLPVAAVWTTLKDYPCLKQVYDDAGKSKKVIGYDQTGAVWQAEELRSGETWRRYYGFVGRHCIAKVPAEQIDFPWDRDFARPLGPAFDGDMVPLFGMRLGPKAFGLGLFRLGSPMSCKLRVRNHTGLDQTLPPLIEKRPGAVIPTGGFAFDIRLDYTPYNCSGEKVPGLPPPLPADFPYDELPWKAVPRKAGARFELKRPPGPLLPTEEFDVVEFDLSEQFDVSHSGGYELRVRVTAAGEDATKKAAEEYHDYVSFMIADRQPERPAEKPAAAK